MEKDCGLSLKVFSWITCAMEVISSLVVFILCVYCWIVKDVPSIFIYYPMPTDTDEIRHISLEGCVISWSLSILMFLCMWRIISTAVLLFALKKSLVILIQYWIAYKVLILVISTCIGVVSFASSPLAPSALVSFTVDLITCYFIAVLYPEIQKISKGHSIPIHKEKSNQGIL